MQPCKCPTTGFGINHAQGVQFYSTCAFGEVHVLSLNSRSPYSDFPVQDGMLDPNPEWSTYLDEDAIALANHRPLLVTPYYNRNPDSNA